MGEGRGQQDLLTHVLETWGLSSFCLCREVGTPWGGHIFPPRPQRPTVLGRGQVAEKGQKGRSAAQAPMVPASALAEGLWAGAHQAHGGRR